MYPFIKMDLRQRVDEILQGRIKLGAGETKPKSKKAKKSTKKGGVDIDMSSVDPTKLMEFYASGKLNKCPCEPKKKAGVRMAGEVTQRASINKGGKSTRMRSQKSSTNAAGAEKPKTTPWIKHVKKVQKEQNLPYKEALKVASKSYKSKAKPKTSKGGITGGIEAGKKKVKSPWIKYVKEYAKKHNIPYKEALSKASDSYQAMKK